MKRKLLWQKHPFRLLLYLEWILLGMALLAALSPLLRSLHFTAAHVHRPRLCQPSVEFIVLAFMSIAALGTMGLRLPAGSRLWSIVYTGLGFALSCLPVLLIGRGERIFPPLLLIVVLRACLLFPWSGRLFVAIAAETSLLLMLLMSLMRIRPLGIPLGRPLPPRIARMPEEVLQGVLLHLTLNSALLFGLVLLFVLLLVGAVLAEHQSRDSLVSANSRLRQYALLIENQATLQERNRIAREIHDSLGHSLTAQSIQLENVAMFLEKEPQRAAEHLEKARQLAKEALQNVRQSVATLRKSPLAGKSLSAAVDKLKKEFEATTGIQLETEIDSSLSSSLSTEVNTTLYRVIQEALTNISKHSQASKVNLAIRQQLNNNNEHNQNNHQLTISNQAGDRKYNKHPLREEVSTIVLDLEDDGRGFEPRANTTGFGLQGMQERVETLGGGFWLSSKPGQGCKIKVEIPLNQ